MNTESELGRVFDEIAAMAPDPSVLRGRLAGRIRAHRQRRAILVAGAVLGAGAAIGVPIALAVDRRRGPGIEASPLGRRRAPLGLRATWIPDGLVAYSREGSPDRLDGVQEWTTPRYHELYLRNDGSQESEPRFTLWVVRVAPLSVWQSIDPSLSPSDYPLSGQPNTTVGGRPARIDLGANRMASLEWAVGGDVLARLITFLPSGSGEDQLRRLAESTVVDDDFACEVAMSLGWMPPVAQTTPEPLTAKLHVYGSAEYRQQTISVFAPSLGTSAVTVDIFTARSMPPEQPPNEPFDSVTLRGLPGRVRNLPFGSGIEEHAETRLDLPDGRLLVVTCHVGADAAEMRANAIRVTEELSVGSDPDLGWLGRSVPPR